jgi:hypothetical protein
VNRTVCRLLVVGMMAALLSFVTQPPQALAALAAPSNLSPSGVSQSGAPVLQWSRVGKAVKYEVQLATDPSFTTLKYSATTTNHRATPTMTLPQQELFWRVRSVNATNVKSNWNETSYTASEIGGPSLVAPADDPSGSEPLQQPDDPALLTWTPVPNAVSYTIEVDDSDDFVGAKTFTSKTTSYLFQAADPTVPLNSWRVRAVFSGSYNSTWSDVGHFTIGALVAPTLTAPVDSPTTQVVDAVLDWEPVPGAVKYEVQVDTNDQFVDPLADKATVFSTWYAKPATLDNDQYWWRVRAIDVNGKASPWAFSLNQFQRRWPDRPTLAYPNDSAQVGNPFYYQWDPIAHASSYRLEVSEDPSFTGFETCLTLNTTYTPDSADSGCMPTAGNVTYWRVRGIDNPTGVLGLYSDIHQFTYSPAIVNQTAPANGATVDVPTLRWDDYAQAVKYIVTVKKDNGTNAASVTTYSNNWTPTGGTRLNPADGPFHWTVQAVRQDGDSTQVPTFDNSLTFDVSGDVVDTGASALAPQSPANGAHSVRFPELRWEPAFDGTDTPAKSYKVMISQVGSTSVATLADTFPYSAGADDSSTYLTPGVYEWWVKATFADNSTATGPSRTFQIDNLANVTGQRVSLTGQGFNDPTTTCSRSLVNVVPTANEICGNLQQSPVFRWDPKPQAGYYLVYVYNDRDMTNPTPLDVETVSGTMWQPPQTMLKDSQAGTAYYWYVRPCKAPGRCAPDPLGTTNAATNAFDKRSNPISGLEERIHDTSAVLTGDVPEFDDEVVFSWDDYLDTNQAGNDLDVTAMPSTVEAQTYKVQVSTSDTFPNTSATFTSPVIDQTSYTVSSKTLPEGPLFWRVQALDGDGNSLAWSLNKNLTGNARAIKKVSPAPSLVSPANNGTSSGNPTFKWSPLNYAAKYNLEVYKNNDTTLSSANRVVNVTVNQASYAVFDKVLPQSTSPYLWRVRRVDGSNLFGAWSPLRSFRIVGDPPTQTDPNAGDYVTSNDAFFTWLPVDGAASYRFELRRKGDTSGSATLTQGLAWAPTSSIANGSWEWRVAGLDAGNQSLGFSPWRAFKVDTVAPTVISKTPSGKVARTTNFVAKFSEPMKHVDTTSFLIFVKGQQHNLSATVTMSNGNKTATLNPTANLQSGKVYTIKLTGQITDRGGNALTPTSWKATAK